MDGGGGGVVGRAGSGAAQWGTAGLEGQAQITRLEDPERSQEGRLSGPRWRTDWRPAGILRRLLEPREHSPALLQPADQVLHDAPPTVGILVELHRASRAVLVLLRGDHRLDP